MLLILCLLAIPAGENSLRESQLVREMEAVLDAPDFADSFWGVSVYAPLRRRLIYTRHARHNFKPASNLKILTTLLALDRLGPDYTFRTSLWGRPPQDGILEGGLWLQGGGDPAFASQYLEETARDWDLLLQPLLELGIHTIRGGLGLLPASHPSPGFLPSWEWDDLGTSYTTPLEALVAADGWFTVHAESDERGHWQWWLDPPDTPLVSVNLHPRPIEAAAHYNPFSGRLELELPAQNCRQESLVCSHAHPAELFLLRMKAELRRHGIILQDQAGETAPSGLTLLGRLPSQPLRHLATVLMKESQNHFADRFWLAVSQELSDGSSAAAAAHGSSLIREAMELQGWPYRPGSQFVDGSGLSSQNSIRPLELTALLLLGLHRSYAAAWLASFPILGRDGTLSERGRSLSQGRVLAKTGYINRVRTLSGYAITLGGEPLVFSFMANHYSCPTSQVNRSQDALCELLVRLAPDVAVRRQLARRPAEQKAGEMEELQNALLWRLP
jgi:D-alanyl-D-alanine carboxypeptidase/D-alanyl-D-alanine-endopeptidase (penicillin-binding protein 4)